MQEQNTSTMTEVTEVKTESTAQKPSKKKKIGVKIQLTALAIIPALFVCVVLMVFSRTCLTDGLEREAIESMKYLAEATMAGYSNLEGDYHFEDGAFYKGDINLSEQIEQIDNYTASSNADVTLCWGKTRVLTSLTDASTGERIIGTDVSDAVWEAVQRGETYTTKNIVINGLDYVACYMPLKNSDGSIVGMAFAGQPKTEIQEFINTRVTFISIIGIVGLIGAAVYGFFTASNFAKNLLSAQKALGSLAEGELNTEVDAAVLKRADEIGDMGRAIGALIQELREIVGHLLESADNLAATGSSLDSMAAQSSDATDEISRAVDEISRGAVSQAEEIENASGQIVDMGNVIENIVGSVGRLTTTANSMSSAGDASMETMKLLSDSNDKTSAAINMIAEQIQLTNESIQRISEATELITSIASQTNLLSLNASIESARAGEAGRGFAVVATEIQKLAVQSNDAAVEIQNIITKLQSESQKSVEEMKEAEVLMKEQQEKLDDTKAKFSEVSNGIHVSRQGTEEIRVGADSCNSSRTQVIDVISNLSAISEENAASAEETTASMQELNATINMLAGEAAKLKSIANELNEDMKFFKL